MIDAGELSSVGIDIGRVQEWLRRERVCDGSIPSARQLSGGSQNVLIVIEVDGREMVVRRPPVHKRTNSDATMLREALVLRALADTEVPHPRLIAACADVEVTGAAFYLMERVDGVDVDTAIDVAADRRGASRSIGFSVADAAAELAAVELAPEVARQLGRTDRWIERQVGRWRSQLDSYSELPGYGGPADLGAVDEIGDWLDRCQPRAFVHRLIHGDFHLGNLMYSTERPGVSAIVDWELATMGDPLLDLAHMIATWPDGRQMPPVRAVLPDLPTVDEFVERYVQRSGRDVSDLQWYRVLACYRLGIILEGTKARADSGRADPDVGDRLHRVAVQLFDQARLLTGSP